MKITSSLQFYPGKLSIKHEDRIKPFSDMQDLKKIYFRYTLPQEVTEIYQNNEINQGKKL